MLEIQSWNFLKQFFSGEILCTSALFTIIYFAYQPQISGGSRQQSNHQNPLKTKLFSCSSWSQKWGTWESLKTGAKSSPIVWRSEGREQISSWRCYGNQSLCCTNENTPTKWWMGSQLIYSFPSHKWGQNCCVSLSESLSSEFLLAM